MDETPPPELGSITQLFAQVRQGDADAFSPLWSQYFPRLVGLARMRLSGRSAAGEEAEDAAQAALVTFWRQVRDGHFLENLRRDDLWRLLAVFTVRKLSSQRRRDNAAKRGGGRVSAEADLAGDQSLDEQLFALPTHELDVQAAELLARLSEDLQEMAMLRLMGYSTREISERLDCTQRKVQRKLDLVRVTLEQSLSAAEEMT